MIKTVGDLVAELSQYPNDKKVFIDYFETIEVVEDTNQILIVVDNNRIVTPL